MKPLAAVALLLAATALAQRPPPPAPVPPAAPAMPPMPPMPPMGGMLRGSPPGIPPQVAQRLGIPADTVKKVRDLSLDANEQLIGLEADLKRAQLDLERALLEAAPDEAKVLGKLDAIGKAELAVRKNRMSLMLKSASCWGPTPGPGWRQSCRWAASTWACCTAPAARCGARCASSATATASTSRCASSNRRAAAP